MVSPPLGSGIVTPWSSHRRMADIPHGPDDLAAMDVRSAFAGIARSQSGSRLRQNRLWQMVCCVAPDRNGMSGA
jgi:hypothetical protein